MTHYETLQVSESASDAVIRASYKALIQRYHPDRYVPAEEGEALCKAFSAAYDVLKDPESRRAYDMELAEHRERERAAEAEAYARNAQSRAEREARQREAHRASETPGRGPPPPPPPPPPRAAPRPAAPTPQAWSTRPAPWRRFFAKLVDQFVYVSAAILFVIVIGKWKDLSDDTLGWFAMISVYFSIVVFEGAAIEYFGTSPGRWVFGIRLRTASGERLTPTQGWKRSFHLWAAGMGFGLPLISLITYLASYNRLTGRGAAAWDEKHGYVVSVAPFGVGRSLAVAATLFITLCGYGVIGALGNASDPAVTPPATTSAPPAAPAPTTAAANAAPAQDPFDRLGQIRLGNASADDVRNFMALYSQRSPDLLNESFRSRFVAHAGPMLEAPENVGFTLQDVFVVAERDARAAIASEAERRAAASAATVTVPPPMRQAPRYYPGSIPDADAPARAQLEAYEAQYARDAESRGVPATASADRYVTPVDPAKVIPTEVVEGTNGQ